MKVLRKFSLLAFYHEKLAVCQKCRDRQFSVWLFEFFIIFIKLYARKYLGIKFKLNSHTQIFAILRVNLGKGDCELIFLHPTGLSQGKSFTEKKFNISLVFLLVNGSNYQHYICDFTLGLLFRIYSQHTFRSRFSKMFFKVFSENFRKSSLRYLWKILFSIKLLTSFLVTLWHLTCIPRYRKFFL